MTQNQKRQKLISLIFGGKNLLNQSQIDILVQEITVNKSKDYSDKIYLTYNDLAEQFKYFGPEISLSRMKKRQHLVLNYETLIKNVETKLPEFFI